MLCGLILISAAACATREQPPPPVSSPATGTHPTLDGIASWYGPGFNGHRTSSGDIYNQEDLTAASTLFPLGTRLRVTNRENGRSAEVTVNDHGPYLKGRGLDLSKGAARMLGMIGAGTAPVRMEVLETPPGGPAFGQRYFVQVGSFSNPQNAVRVGQRFAGFYPDVHIEETGGGESRYYRVRMGAFFTRQAAEERATHLTGFGYPIVIVTE